MAKKAAFNEDDLFDDLLEEPEFISTGIRDLDRRLGGGIPEGVVVEAYGDPFAGKTSLGYHLAGEIQRQKLGRSVLIDAEGSYNPAMARRCGIDIEEVNEDGKKTFLKTARAEDKIIETVFSKIESILENMPDVRLIIVDSIAALIPEKMMTSEDVTERYAMLRANVLTQRLPALEKKLAESGKKTIIYFINHEKEEIGMNGPGPKKKKTLGGKGLSYATSMRLEFKAVKKDWKELRDPVTGQITREMHRIYVRCQATKNRFASPYNPSTFVFTMERGIDHLFTALRYAYDEDIIIKKGGGYYTIPADLSHSGEDESVRGEPNVETYFEEHPEALDRLLNYADTVAQADREVAPANEDALL